VSISKLQKDKIAFVLAKLPLGAVQSRVTVERNIRVGRKPPKGQGESSIDRRPLVKRVKVVKGTGIPASTLKKFQSLEYSPKKTSIKKLVNFYERYQFQRLRAAGVNAKEAKRIKSYEHATIDKTISTFKKNAIKIQRHYENAYYKRVKDFKKQEREKLKPKKPVPPPPPVKKPPRPPTPSTGELDFEDEELISVYSGTDTYLDEDEEEQPEAVPAEAPELTEPPPNDYPSLDEIIFGMSESTHLESEWDGVTEAYAGVEK
jgi:ABC-type uncharacterized transport system involved in gliding motility auxiliary subunit